MSELLSPKQVARVIGVSESSLKRWVDQGLIQAVRTAGGHRKLPLEDVMRFMRERDHRPVHPELLTIPATSPQSELGLRRGKDLLLDALLAGNEVLARQIVFDLYLAKHGIAAICDHVIATAFHSIGEKWSCQEVDVYQERRGCEIALRVIHELRRSLPHPDSKLIALGGTMQGDLYSVPITMAELVIRDAGWTTSHLGTSLPTDSLVSAIESTKPQLFWMSVSHIADESEFLSEFAKISTAATRNGAAIAVGGRSLTEGLRREMTYSSFCDTMQHLDAFARTLAHASMNAATPE